MSANDSKIYFWVKLKKDFFENHKIRIIEGMQNGQSYVLLYLKLMCEATSHEGYLRFSNEIPYTESMIANLTNMNIDTIHTAFDLFKQLGMLVQYEDGTYFIPEVRNLIGKETGQTIRKRIAREEENKPKSLEQGKNYHEQGKSGVNFTLESRDKSLDNRNNSLDKSNSLLDKLDILDIPQNEFVKNLIEKKYLTTSDDRLDFSRYEDLFDNLEIEFGRKNLVISLRYFLKQVLDTTYDPLNEKVEYHGLKKKIEDKYNYLKSSLRKSCERFVNSYDSRNDEWAKSFGFENLEQLQETLKGII